MTDRTGAADPETRGGGLPIHIEAALAAVWLGYMLDRQMNEPTPERKAVWSEDVRCAMSIVLRAAQLP